MTDKLWNNRLVDENGGRHPGTNRDLHQEEIAAEYKRGYWDGNFRGNKDATAALEKVKREAADEIARLQAELALANEKLAWQPIETAPKGTRVLLYRDDQKRFEIQDSKNFEHWRGHPALAYTHWMPLPELPKETD